MNVKDHSIGDTDEKTKKTQTRKSRTKRMAPPTRGEALIKGVFMGFVISGVTHASKTITSTLLRHPLALFSTGFVGGYFTHKYRKEIIAVSSRTAMESKNFVLRQKENLLDLVAESREYAAEQDKAE
ncbi:MAG: hypothetical protein PHH11_02210 [Methylomonas sp.]|nr:hypothetical protein [Methylomonas sp.]